MIVIANVTIGTMYPFDVYSLVDSGSRHPVFLCVVKCFQSVILKWVLCFRQVKNYLIMENNDIYTETF